MSGHHKHTIHKDHIHHGWNNAFPPAVAIAPGESVAFKTADASVSGILLSTMNVSRSVEGGVIIHN